jgi:hypothetical protein
MRPSDEPELPQARIRVLHQVTEFSIELDTDLLATAPDDENLAHHPVRGKNEVELVRDLMRRGHRDSRAGDRHIAQGAIADEDEISESDLRGLGHAPAWLGALFGLIFDQHLSAPGSASILCPIISAKPKEFGNAGTPVEDITGLHDCLTILALTRA